MLFEVQDDLWEVGKHKCGGMHKNKCCKKYLKPQKHIFYQWWLVSRRTEFIMKTGKTTFMCFKIIQYQQICELITIILTLPMRKLRFKEDREPRISTARIWNQMFLILKAHFFLLYVTHFYTAKNSSCSLHSDVFKCNTENLYINKQKTTSQNSTNSYPEIH